LNSGSCASLGKCSIIEPSPKPPPPIFLFALVHFFR
jgi:hypothetical protein